jgi:VCBS repeat-containing protein
MERSTVSVKSKGPAIYCRRMLVFVSIVFAFLVGTSTKTHSAEVTLGWNASTSAAVVGYILYHGDSSRDYNVHVDVENSTTYTFQDLLEGSTYFFAVTAYDTYGNESDYSAEVVYTVPRANNAPVADNGALTTSQNVPKAGKLNAIDADGDALIYSIVQFPAKGSVSITDSSAGYYTYTPNLNATGTDTFTFKASDGTADSNTATVTVTITQANRSPMTSNGTLGTTEDTAATGQLSASDVDGNTLTFNLVQAAGKGTVTITGATTGAFTYTPNANANGTDTFTFKATDGAADSNTSTVTVTITAANDAPVALDDTAATPEDTAVSVNVLANDSDVDGDTLAVVAVSQPANGSVSAGGTGVTYTPKADFHGRDSFTYMVSDGMGGTAAATVRITVRPGNDPPVASESSMVTAGGVAARGRLRATDVDGDPLTFTIVKPPTMGLLLITGSTTGSYTYTPHSGITGEDSFTFKASDGKADSKEATVAVTIQPNEKIVWEAEDGQLNPPMETASGIKASGGEYVLVPAGAGTILDPTENGGYAEYVFEVPVSRTYALFARIMADSPAANSFYVSVDHGEYIRWEAALGARGAWIWDYLTEGSASSPVRFYLSAGKHTLILKQCEAGVKLDKIRMATNSDHLSETIWEDAEDGAITGWKVYDEEPAGALIENVVEDDRQGRVIKLTGTGVKNGYRLRWRDGGKKPGSPFHTLEWSLNFSEDFVICVVAKTTAGTRYISYAPRDDDPLGEGAHVGFGLGSKVSDGQWHKFVRNLQADLNKAQPGVVIEKVVSVLIRGSGMVDDIKLRQHYL